MTATLERPAATPERPQGSPSPKESLQPPSTTTVGTYLRWVLAALSLGAGGIHFAMISPHWDEYWVEGVFFSALAWFQLAWAAGIVLRPTRLLLTAGAAVSAATIGVWAISRTWGVPFGPHAGVPEASSFVDITATAFEGAILLGCLALLLRPALGHRTVSRIGGALPAGIAGLGVVALSTMAFTPSFASGHSHGPPGHPAGGHGAGEASGAAAGAPHMDDHGDGSDMAGHASGSTNVSITADGTSACEQAGVANEGNSGHGHRGPVPVVPMDEATRAAYQQQVATATNVALTYPTAADAEAAGWRRITPYVPCIAAHYIKGSALRNPFDPAEPEILLYEGTDPDSGIVGLSYLQFADPKQAPDGFVGENDPWHVHRQLCIGGAGVLGDETTTPEQCAERGGSVIPLDNLWMNHMWPVPGWESRWGLFSSEHPDLGGKIGDINATPDGQANTANLKDK